MIRITYHNFYETREELGKRISELKRDIISRLSRLLTFDECTTLEFNYCVLRAQLEVLEFVEYFMLDGGQKNWLTIANVPRPVKHPRDMKKLLQETMQMVLKKEPSYGVKYNSIYFMALHYLNRIQIEEKDDGA